MREERAVTRGRGHRWRRTITAATTCLLVLVSMHSLAMGQSPLGTVTQILEGGVEFALSPGATVRPGEDVFVVQEQSIGDARTVSRIARATVTLVSEARARARIIDATGAIRAGDSVVAARSRGTGTVRITSRVAGIDVSIDGRTVGTTRFGAELIVSDLRPGHRRIVAQKSGAERAYTVDLEAGQTRTVLVHFEERELVAEDGSRMLLVPAGPFLMGAREDEVMRSVEDCRSRNAPALPECEEQHENQQPLHRVVLRAFYIDEHEVTIARFERFVRATRYRTTAENRGASTVWRLINDAPRSTVVSAAWWKEPGGPTSAAEPAHPVVHVSWDDAEAFCRHYGNRLPSEAEWEKAARGDDQRRYPWGNEWDARRLHGAGSATMPTQVGSYEGGRSPYGVRDLAGNVWEWVADYYHPRFYQQRPTPNPQGPASGTERVLRGGSWADADRTTTSTYRHHAPPHTSSNVIGFRCAWSAG